jgi:glycosyltransferase involved in cell wall biosynthesis
MLTALMPLKNYHADFLRQSIDSLRAQSSSAWRLLVIVEERDFEALAPLVNVDERITTVVNEGRGLAGAFNTGMRKATTDFVAILLSDDLWSHDAVAVLTHAISTHPGVDFFHSSRRIVDGNGASLSSVHRSREHFAREDFTRTSPVKHLLCWRREFALAFGGMDESLPPVGPDDYDFPWSMFDAGARFHAIPECLYIYRDHREAFRLTTHLPLDVHKLGIRRILEKHGIDEETIARRIAQSETTYLRQCLYTSRDDKAAKEALGHDAREGWRDKYF